MIGWYRCSNLRAVEQTCLAVADERMREETAEPMTLLKGGPTHQELTGV